VRVHTLLGTCVSIALWHPLKRLGGMCHFLLPTRGLNAVDPAQPGLYADEVMTLFADAVRGTQSLPRDFVVKIAGGGNMFPDQVTDADCREGGCTDGRRAVCPSVGCRNVGAARRLLQAEGYVIASQHVGGHGSRQVVFDLWSGEVWVKRGAAMAGGSQAAA
jgi:chemotaxis protein CheD